METEEIGKGMNERISGKKENKLEVCLGKSFLLELCFLSCQQGSVETGRVPLSSLPAVIHLQAAIALVALISWANSSYLH